MKILVTGRLPDEIMTKLKSGREVVSNTEDRPMERSAIIEHIGDKEGLLCMVTDRIDDELLEHAPLLRMIANYGVGFDNIDLNAATARGIWVSNTPGVLIDATADITFALILAVARRLIEGEKRVREGLFKHWAPMLFLGTEVSGKTLGVVGLGDIGTAVARRAQGFNMRILYNKRKPLPKAEEQKLNATYADLDDLLAQSDFVSLHCPLTQATRHLIGARELDLMKPTAFLINAARGPVVDEAALTEALRENKIAGAGLDVYENEPEVTPELKELHNVVLLPHIGSATTETRTKMAELAVENLLAGLRGDRPPNCLNCEPGW